MKRSWWWNKFSRTIILFPAIINLILLWFANNVIFRCTVSVTEQPSHRTADIGEAEVDIPSPPSRRWWQRSSAEGLQQSPSRPPAALSIRLHPQRLPTRERHRKGQGKLGTVCKVRKGCSPMKMHQFYILQQCARLTSEDH